MNYGLVKVGVWGGEQFICILQVVLSDIIVNSTAENFMLGNPVVNQEALFLLVWITIQLLDVTVQSLRTCTGTLIMFLVQKTLIMLSFE